MGVGMLCVSGSLLPGETATFSFQGHEPILRGTFGGAFLFRWGVVFVLFLLPLTAALNLRRGGR